jgi:hypothetical protein
MNLFFSELYMEFGTSIVGEKLFGLGERRGTYLLNTGKYTVFNKD